MGSPWGSPVQGNRYHLRGRKSGTGKDVPKETPLEVNIYSKPAGEEYKQLEIIAQLAFDDGESKKKQSAIFRFKKTVVSKLEEFAQAIKVDDKNKRQSDLLKKQLANLAEEPEALNSRELDKILTKLDTSRDNLFESLDVHNKERLLDIVTAQEFLEHPQNESLEQAVKAKRRLTETQQTKLLSGLFEEIIDVPAENLAYRQREIVLN